jgi:hypothetical protein
MSARKLVASKGSIRADMTYIRKQLQYAEQAIQVGNWSLAKECFSEISAIAVTQEGSCRDNYYGIENSYAEKGDYIWTREQ